MGRPGFSYSAAVVLFLLFSFLITGCGGGGGGQSGVLQPDAPETAVRALIADWKSNGTVPGLRFDGSGKASLVYQTAGDASATAPLKFKDMSGSEWNFYVESISRPSTDRAEVRTYAPLSYVSTDPAASRAYVTFIMILDQGRWYLNDLTVELPAAVITSESAIEGYLSEKGNPDVRLQGAGVTLYQGQTKISTTVTDANGYYKFTNLLPGTYTLVFVGGGYETLTITGVVVN